mmetsp:Transcript_10341/g.25705  ORF Transcript_10341/g.25705 Transcript_10341/m.25705 type:complete len:202 (-) Transcript_10341:393-998(-)
MACACTPFIHSPPARTSHHCDRSRSCLPAPLPLHPCTPASNNPPMLTTLFTPYFTPYFTQVFTPEFKPEFTPSFLGGAGQHAHAGAHHVLGRCGRVLGVGPRVLLVRPCDQVQQRVQLAVVARLRCLDRPLQQVLAGDELGVGGVLRGGALRVWHAVLPQPRLVRGDPLRPHGLALGRERLADGGAQRGGQRPLWRTGCRL